MRFGELRLTTYGGFTNRDIPLPRAGLDLHVLIGRNEAGKSTVLRALSNFLFGFGHLAQDAYLHEPRDLRIGGRIGTPDGQELVIFRKRGNTKTLLDAEEQPLPDDLLASLLGGVQRDFFENVFGLDHQRLREGGRLLVENKGDLATSLFAAGTGIAGLRKAMQRLQTDAEQLFKPRSQTAIINKALAAHYDARRRTKEHSLATTEWTRQTSELTVAEEAQRVAEAEFLSLSTELSRWERLQKNLPPLSRLRTLDEQLSPLASVPRFRDEQVKRRKEAQDARVIAHGTLVATEPELQRIEKELEQLQINDLLLAGEAELEWLRSHIANMRVITVEDLPKQRAKLESWRLQIAAKLTDAGLIPTKGSDPEIPRTPTLRNIRSLIAQYESLASTQSRLAQEESKLQSRLQILQGELKVLPPSVAVAPLRAVVDELTEVGSLDRDLDKTQERITELQQDVAANLKALKPWKGQADDLAKLALPTPAAVKRYREQFAEIQADLKATQKDVIAENLAIKHVAVELARLDKRHDLPTPQALEETRAKRDEGWKLIRQVYIEKNQDPRSATKGYDPKLPLPEAYETHVQLADELSDKQISEADRVAHYENAALQKAQHEAHYAELTDQLTNLNKAVEKLRRKWLQEWHALGAEPGSPEEMLLWQETFGETQNLLREVAVASREAQAIQKQMHAVQTAMGKALVGASVPAGSIPKEWRDAIRMARNILTEGEKTNAARQDLTTQSQRLKQDILAKGAERKSTEDLVAAWQSTWKQSIHDLHREGGESPDELRVAVERLEEIHTLLGTRDAAFARVQEMETFQTQFRSALDQAVKRYAPELTGQDALDAAGSLIQTFDATRTATTLRSQLLVDKARHTETLQRATGDADAATQTLVQLCLEVHCASEAALMEFEDRAALKVRLQTEYDEQVHLLEESNPGYTLETLRQEAAGIDPDTLPGRMETIRDQVEKARNAARACAETVGQRRTVLDSNAGGPEAADAAQEAQGALALVATHALEYRRLRAASWLLTRVLEEYQQRNQGPLLRQASGYFARVTDGAFSGLKTDYQDGSPVLLGVRPGGRTLSIEEMSDGTADQLYLCLRLAAIHRHLEDHPPLPMVLDDVLVNFDDDRAIATLKLLGEFSQKTQILFLTHHRHLVHLAQQSLGAELPAVVDLGGNSS